MNYVRKKMQSVDWNSQPFYMWVYNAVCIFPVWSLSFVMNNWGEAKSVPRSGETFQSGVCCLGRVSCDATHALRLYNVCVCDILVWPASASEARSKANAAALHLIRRGAHCTHRSNQRCAAVFLFFDWCIRMCAARERESQLHRHTFIDASLASLCSADT